MGNRFIPIIRKVHKFFSLLLSHFLEKTICSVNRHDDKINTIGNAMIKSPVTTEPRPQQHSTTAVQIRISAPRLHNIDAAAPTRGSTQRRGPCFSALWPPRTTPTFHLAPRLQEVSVAAPDIFYTNQLLPQHRGPHCHQLRAAASQYQRRDTHAQP